MATDPVNTMNLSSVSLFCVCYVQIFWALICKDKEFPSDLYKTWEEAIYFVRNPKDNRDAALAGEFRNTYDCVSWESCLTLSLYASVNQVET